MKNIIWVLIILILLSGCCQREGAYEDCLARGHNLCIDIYPKCDCDD